MNRRQMIMTVMGALAGGTMATQILKIILSNQTGKTSDVLMPALFVGHGSPMNAIEANAFTAALGKMGTSLPRPRAILVVSAHWLTRGARVLKVERPETIHDFYGFPEPLYQIQYAAPGAPELAEQIALMMKEHSAETDSEWGLDHGAWSVLHHMYPNADIPVLQLSLNRNLDFRGHLELARDLSALRKQGVLILGSGNITHNLREIDFSPNARPFAWAEEFDEMIKSSLLQRDLSQLMAEDSAKHPLWMKAHPTLEHYLPLLYVTGVSEENETPTFPYEGIMAGSLSMRAVQYG